MADRQRRADRRPGHHAGYQAWAQANLARLTELLNSNPSYVFFRRLNNNQGGPLGALAYR